jgi:hypothetical protein
LTPTDTAGGPDSPGPAPPGPGPPGPEPPPPLGPAVGGEEVPAGGDAPVTPGTGICGTSGTVTRVAREPRLLVTRSDSPEATLAPPRLERSPVTGITTRALSAAPMSMPERLGAAAGWRCDLPSASRGIRDSKPRSSNDGNDSTPPASISSGTSIAATAASAAASRPETERLLKANVAPRGTETASSFVFTCRPFSETISHVPVAPCHLIEQFEPPGGVIYAAEVAQGATIRYAADALPFRSTAR